MILTDYQQFIPDMKNKFGNLIKKCYISSISINRSYRLMQPNKDGRHLDQVLLILFISLI